MSLFVAVPWERVKMGQTCYITINHTIWMVEKVDTYRGYIRQGNISQNVAMSDWIWVKVVRGSM